LESPILLRKDILPMVIVLLRTCNRPQFGFGACRYYVDLIPMKQSFFTFPESCLMGILPLIAIPLNLYIGFMERIGCEFIGILALHDCQRETIHEQDNVRSNRAF